MEKELGSTLKQFILSGAVEPKVASKPDAFLAKTCGIPGTELWLDTGDMDESRQELDGRRFGQDRNEHGALQD